jgi:hypothetical protein
LKPSVSPSAALHAAHPEISDAGVCKYV